MVVEGKPDSGPRWFPELEKGLVTVVGQYQTRKETFLKASFAKILSLVLPILDTFQCNEGL